jgi:hypothetical protein
MTVIMSLARAAMAYLSRCYLIETVGWQGCRPSKQRDVEVLRRLDVSKWSYEIRQREDEGQPLRFDYQIYHLALLIHLTSILGRRIVYL